MSEYCKECDSVTIKVKGIDASYIALTGFALIFGVCGYWYSKLFRFTDLELMLFFSIGAIMIFAFGLAANVLRYSKLKEIKEE